MRLHAILSTTLLFCAVASTGCKPPPYPACKKDKHCKQDLGEACVDGQCQNCKTDDECKGKGPGGTDVACKEFRCDTGDGTQGAVPGELGAPCTSKTDCTGGWACREGTCQTCNEDAECAPSTCNVETGRCSSTGMCTKDDECPMDEICDGGTCVFPGEPGKNECGLDAVYFGFDNDQVTPKMAESMQAAAQCMKDSNKNIILEAHADNVGTEEYNILLTERRGLSVKTYLVDLGVPDANLQVIAKGSLEAAGTSEADRAKDRRVQFIFP